MKIILPLRLELKAAVTSEQMVMMRSSCDPARVTERENKNHFLARIGFLTQAA